MLKLYYHPLSTFARRVRIALIEKSIDAELVEVDMPAGAHKGPEYRALNPYGRVPTIDDDGFILYESTAILEYLEATRPAPALVPADPQGRALVAMHMKLCDLQLGRPTGTIIFPKRFLPPQRWVHTENSYKYTVDEFQALAQKAGFSAGRVWTDRDNLFSVHFFQRVDALR